MRAVAGLPAANGRGPGVTRCGAVWIIDLAVSTLRADGRRASVRTAMAMALAGAAVVVAAVRREATTVGGSGTGIR